MFAANIFGFTAKHSEAKSLFDVVVAIDRWSDRIENLLSDFRLTGQISDCLLILICQLNNHLITKSLQVVDFDQSLENWETMFRICNLVVPVHVNTCDFDFVTGSSSID